MVVGVRFAAWLIDIVIIWVSLRVLSATPIDELIPLDFGIYDLSAIDFLLAFLYYILLTGTRGQTLGKMALGIKVVREEGLPPGLGYAALREFPGKLISSIALLLGFLWIIWDRDKQGWHDKIAGTHAVRVQRWDPYGGQRTTGRRLSP